MTDDPDVTYAMRAALFAELNLLDWLLTEKALTFAGMQLVHWRINQPADVLDATGSAYEVRERLNDRLIRAMAAESNMPESYWRDRPLLDQPLLDDGREW
jgi:hypothetical protein